MESHVPPSLDKPAEHTLLTSKEFKKFLRQAQRLQDYPQVLSGAAAPLILVTIIVGSLATVWLGSEKPIKCIIYMIVLVVVLLSTVREYEGAYVSRQKSKLARLVTAISETQDADMLGPILDLGSLLYPFERTCPEIRPTVDVAVLRLLPLITAAHAESLNTQQRKCLHGYWWRNQSGSYGHDLNDVPYMPGLTHAFEQIGDKRDLPEIQSCLRTLDRPEEVPASTQHPFDVPKDRAVSEERKELIASLQHCLETVAERVAREEGKDFLLRPDCKPEALLRPVAECTDNPPNQLLRASSDDSAPPS